MQYIIGKVQWNLTWIANYSIYLRRVNIFEKDSTFCTFISKQDPIFHCFILQFYF